MNLITFQYRLSTELIQFWIPHQTTIQTRIPYFSNSESFPTSGGKECFSGLIIDSHFQAFEK